LPPFRTPKLEHVTATAREGSDFGYGVFRASDPTSVVGGCGLHRRIGAGGIEIGYWIHVDAIGNGYATELAGALIRVALQLTDIDRSRSTVTKQTFVVLLSCASSATCSIASKTIPSRHPQRPGRA
jgi:RimJ/RimL family protein N-acetyltransferase